MESARDFIKQFSRNSIKLLFGKRSTNLLRYCRTIWMNGCGNTMNHVRTAGNIAMGKRRCRHSWIPYHLQKRKCCSIVATFQSKKKYDGSSDDVVTSTFQEGRKYCSGRIKTSQTVCFWVYKRFIAIPVAAAVGGKFSSKNPLKSSS